VKKETIGSAVPNFAAMVTKEELEMKKVQQVKL
jgi:hypothetical protein